MTQKIPPFSLADIQSLSQQHPTPFYIYDEAAIRANVRDLHQTFAWVQNFKNYFAVKALPNPAILQVLRDEGCALDCSSMGELMLAKRVGAAGGDIMFTSNNTPASEYQMAHDMGAIINFDDLSHIAFYEQNIGPLPELVCFRYNPGPLKDGNAIIGEPKEAKYGLTTAQIFEAYRICKAKGVKRFGLHTMVCSNETNADYFIETIDLLFSLAGELFVQEGVSFEFINIGGGLGIPYQVGEARLDLQKISTGMQKVYQSKLRARGHPDCQIVMESGRYITGPYGYLVAQVMHKKHIYKNYIGLDASMANLIRPGVYGAHHHLSVLGKEDDAKTHMYDVTGSLCENNDKFAIDRMLPKIDIGDYLVLHDAGAHGHAMGFQYNAKLRSAEFLQTTSGEFQMIRRAETLDDYFATLPPATR